MGRPCRRSGSRFPASCRPAPHGHRDPLPLPPHGRFRAGARAWGGDEEQAVAALLHDAIEDCGAEHEAIIAARFAPRVAAIGRACTDAEVFPTPPWRARKEAYLSYLDHAEPDALLVSACDKLHNARAIVEDLREHGPAMMTRVNAGRDGTLWCYRSLAVASARLLLGRLAGELARAVDEMERLAS